MTSSTLTVRPLTEADRPAALELIELSLAGGPTGHRSTEFFDWKHVANVFGPSLGLVATDDAGTLVGLRLFMRWRFEIAGRIVEAARPVDTATHPDHRGRGIFRTLTMAALEHLPAETLIFNTPNDQSRPGYLKMGWSVVGKLPVHVRVVRPVRFATRVARSRAAIGTSGEAVDCSLPAVAGPLDDPGLPDLLTEVAGDPDVLNALATRRDPAFLHWRYAAAPGLDYRAATVHEGGRLVGLAIGRPRRRGGLSELTLSEVLVRPGDSRTARRLLRAVSSSGCDHVATHSSVPAVRSALRSSGFLPVPRAGMVLTAFPRAPLPVDPCDAQSWRLSLGELEVF